MGAGDLILILDEKTKFWAFMSNLRSQKKLVRTRRTPISWLLPLGGNHLEPPRAASHSSAWPRAACPPVLCAHCPSLAYNSFLPTQAVLSASWAGRTVVKKVSLLVLVRWSWGACTHPSPLAAHGLLTAFFIPALIGEPLFFPGFPPIGGFSWVVCFCE